MPPHRYQKWRIMLGQTADEEEYQAIEEMKRRKIPELVRKLITVYGPTKRSVEEWKNDFENTNMCVRPRHRRRRNKR